MPVTALQVVLPGGSPQVYSLDNIRRIIVGCGEESDLRIQDPALEPRQFEIYRVDHIEGPIYFIYDLSSSNGTRVDGERVNNVRLATGATIQAGSCAMHMIQCPAEQALLIPVRRRSHSGNGSPAPTEAAPKPPAALRPVVVPAHPPAAAPPPAPAAPGLSQAEEAELKAELEVSKALIEEFKAEVGRLCEENARQVERLETERDMACSELERIVDILVQLERSVAQG